MPNEFSFALNRMNELKDNYYANKAREEAVKKAGTTEEKSEAVIKKYMKPPPARPVSPTSPKGR